MQLKYYHQNGQHIFYRDDPRPCATQAATDTITFDPGLFEPEILQAADKIYGSARGRGTSYFFRENNQSWVLKHYRRGGLMGKLCKDSYCRQPLHKTRPVRELRLLALLEQLKLPAPQPIAGRIIYRGLFYRADIITGVIENSQSLVQRLGEPLDAGLWQTIGATIKRFHRHNIYHADLNAHNILMDERQAFFLIDFDKGAQIGSNGNDHWKGKTLRRLQRSLVKERARNTLRYFDDGDWATLMAGYDSA